ncbi:unnamed protein product [Caenorhabditis angaria]|uniref:Autophagy-related protein 16 domain-containing protein n=1 Tax=Caenorhabditis angaria TaxID=860376 RepID=A0A9P1J0L5_9PELO|nr:unnamed protein product [Caenorhabditis angaria]
MSKNDSFVEKISQQLDESQLKSKDFSDFCKHYAALSAEAEQKANVRNQNDEGSRLQDEIAQLYIDKGKNDQMLIDANTRNLRMEEKMEDFSHFLKQMDENYKKKCAKYAQLEVEFKRMKSDHSDNKDERLAFNTNVALLRDQIQKLEDERIQLMNKIRQLNEQKNEIQNAETQLEERRASLMAKDRANSQSIVRKDQEMTKLAAPEKEIKSDLFLADTIPTIKMFNIKIDDGEVNDVKWISQDTFATGGSDRCVKLWKTTDDEPLKLNSLTGSSASITQLDFDPQRRNLLASSNDKNLLLYNMDLLRLTATLSGHSDSVTCTKFYSTNGAISGSADRILKIWDLASQRCTRSFYPISKILDLETRFATSPAIFASAHHDKNVRIWDGRSSEPAQSVVLGGRVTSLFMSKTGQEMLCSTRDDTLSLIDIRTFGIVHNYSFENYHTSSDYSRCVISPGGDYVAAGGSNGAVVIWNKMTARIEKVLQSESESTVLSIAWNPTGQGLLSAFRQKNVACYK